MKKRILAIFLTVCLLAALTGCSGGGETVPESSSNASAGGTVDESKYPGLTEQEKEAVELGLLNLDGTMPIIPDPDAFEEKYGKISMFVHYTGGRTRPVTELEIVKMWEELTGIRFEWEDVPYDGVAEKINLTLSAAGDDLPDCFYNFVDGQSGIFTTQYADQEVFIPTEDIIDNYMPSYKALLDSKTEYRLEATAPDGHIYGFPYIEEMQGLVLTPGPFEINADWLEQVGMSMPETVDEWVECLKAFRDAGDLNGNGEDDEVPLAVQFGQHDTFGSNDLFYRFTGAFGQADSYCEGNRYADHLFMEDGKVIFSATDEAFRKTAEFFNMLWEEDLIWNGSFEADTSLYFENSLLKRTWQSSAPSAHGAAKSLSITLMCATSMIAFRAFRVKMEVPVSASISRSCRIPRIRRSRQTVNSRMQSRSGLKQLQQTRSFPLCPTGERRMLYLLRKRTAT